MILAAFPRSGYAPLTASDVIEAPEPEPEPEPPAPPEPWIVHPGATLPNGSVKSIEHMKVIDGVLYLAISGNWEGGSYPLAWVDLATGIPTTGPMQPSEGFPVVRQLSSGRIIYPWVDPTGPWGDPQGYTYSDNGIAGPWEHQLIFPAYHVLDVREHGGALWVCGAGPLDGVETAQVWKSEDGGDTWIRSFTATGGSLPRVYSLLPVGDELWIDPTATTAQGPLRLEGDDWVPHEVPNDTGREPTDSSWHQSGHVVSAGGVVYGRHGAFDGTRFIGYRLGGQQVGGAILPSWSDSTHIYAVPEASTSIVRAPLLTPGSPGVVEWEPWLSLGEGMAWRSATSATRHDGFVYVGGTQGRIWRLAAIEHVDNGDGSASIDTVGDSLLVVDNGDGSASIDTTA